MRKALVVSGMDNIALALSRSLGERGYRVAVAGAGPGTPLKLSRRVSLFRSVAGSVGELEAGGRDAVEAVTALAGDFQPDLIVPADVGGGALAPSLRARLPGPLFFPSPPPEALALNDKWAFHEFAAGLGLPQPRTRRLARAADASADLPVVIKPLSESGGRGIFVARAAADLAQAGSGAVLAQEYVEGREVSMSFLADDGRLLAWAVHVRRADGALEYVDDPRVVAFGRRFAEACRYRGIGNVDMRYDDADPSRILLIECNPRFWGSYPYTLGLGVDFLGLGLALAEGRPPRPMTASPRGLFPGVLASARALLSGRLEAPAKAYLSQKLLDPGPELWKAFHSVFKIGGAR